MIHKGLLKIHQEPKVAKLGFCRKSQLNFDQAYLSHTLWEMTHPKLILKRMKFPTIHLHTPRSRNALTKSYKFGHYRSFFKVNKNTFFSKAYNLIMEDQNEIILKYLIRGHLKVSKKSYNTSKSSKLKKLCIVEVGHFSKIAKSQLSPKLQILSNGPILFHLIWSCHTPHVS